MTTKKVSSLDPKILGFWVKCIRDALNWSQEALAEACGLNVRTIQRFERGETSNITTKMAIARGLKYEDPKIFDDPKFAKAVSDVFFQLAGSSELDKTHMAVQVKPANSGAEIGKFLLISDAISLNSHDQISDSARSLVASLFDYITEIQDIYGELSFSDRIEMDNFMSDNIKSLVSEGCSVYIGHKSGKMIGERWEVKMPMSYSAMYVYIVPSSFVVEEIRALRRLS